MDFRLTFNKFVIIQNIGLKRLLLTFLSVTYFIGITGLPLHLQYCCGDLVGFSIEVDDDSNCCCNDAQGKKSKKLASDCCEEKALVFSKLNDVKSIIYKRTALSNLYKLFALPHSKFYCRIERLTPVLSSIRPLTKPPDKEFVPLYLSNSTFLI